MEPQLEIATANTPTKPYLCQLLDLVGYWGMKD